MGLEIAGVFPHFDADAIRTISDKFTNKILDINNFEEPIRRMVPFSELASLNRLEKVKREAVAVADNNLYYAQRREDMAFHALCARRHNNQPSGLSRVEGHNLAVKDIERKLEETKLTVYDLNQAELKVEQEQKAAMKKQQEKEKKYLELQAKREDLEARRQAEARAAEKAKNLEKHKAQNQAQKDAAAKRGSKSARRRARRKQK